MVLNAGSTKNEAKKTKAVGASNAVSVRILLSFLRDSRLKLTFSVCLGLAGGGAALAQPALVGAIISGIRSGENVTPLIVLLISLFGALAVLGSAEGYVLGSIGERIVLNIRKDMTSRILGASVMEHDRSNSGDTLSRFSSDIPPLRRALTQALSGVAIGIVTFLGAVVLMALIDVLLLLTVAVCVIVGALLVMLITKGIRSAVEEEQRMHGLLLGNIERVLRAIRTVKVSTAEDREARRIWDSAESVYRAGMIAIRLEALLGPATTIAVQGSFVAVIGFGGARLATGQMTLGELVTFLLYLIFSITPLIALSDAYVDLQEGLAAVRRLTAVLDLEQENATRPSHHEQRFRSPVAAHSVSNARPIVKFQDVGFSYDGRRQAVRNLSFEVAHSGLTAIVGPSGAGKSTIFSLMERFYNPQRGQIFLGGEDIQNLPIRVLREKVALVEQESPILAGSILENIVYADPTASSERIDRVLRQTNLDEFVNALPDSLDSEAGESGVMLSGGERQRIATARMLLKEPEVLLLDEVTSQLDANNERALKETILAIARDRAVFVIAHRLSTVLNADQIILMDGGEKLAVGSHADLMRSSELYAELVNTQIIPAP